MAKLENLTPQEVIKYFEQISAIPRGSGNEEAVSNFVAGFGKQLGLETYQDDTFNVVIKKPGTKGYENAPVVAIQGHLDMVCEKNKDIQHDFLTDGLSLLVEGDALTAEGTTLGADNGIGVAYGMALLAAEDISHPPLEVMFTTNEETGMDGAKALDPGLISARRLINLDSEDEGIFWVSCAGGLRAELGLPLQWERVPGYTAQKIQLKGLAGGHSGAEIHLQRGNANKLLGVLLDSIMAEGVYIHSVAGGSKDNVIPREAEAVVLSKNPDKIEKTILNCAKELKEVFSATDNDMEINILTVDQPVEKAIAWESGVKLVALLMALPNGVCSMMQDIEGLVESSLNLGILEMNEKEICFSFAVRSASANRKKMIDHRLKNIAWLAGASYQTKSGYPAWQFNPKSYLLKVFQETYEDLYHKKGSVQAIHAGLECGMFAEKWPDCDMISIGPDMRHVHSPEEMVSITSVERTWQFLKAVLKRLK